MRNILISFLPPMEHLLNFSVSQKMMIIKILFNVLSWGVGMWSVYEQKVYLFGAVSTFNISLGVAVFINHTSSNEKVNCICCFTCCSCFQVQLNQSSLVLRSLNMWNRNFAKRRSKESTEFANKLLLNKDLHICPWGFLLFSARQTDAYCMLFYINIFTYY